MNVLGQESGFVAAVKRHGYNTWIPTKLGQLAGLTGIVKFNRTDLSFFTDETYDLSNWQSVVLQRQLAEYAEYKNFIDAYEAEMLSYGDGKMRSGISWFKMKVPFC